MPIVRADLAQKHLLMRSAPFPFMRATFYRWCQVWRERSGDAARGTRVLAVGDLHIENFGTWRDVDGRLIWGINDFDEATSLPWTMDLVRLAVSAFLAIEGDHLRAGRRNACDAILEGYNEGLACGGRPFVLEEEHGWLRKIATAELRDPTVFWRKMNALRTVRAIDRSAAQVITAAMPARESRDPLRAAGRRDGQPRPAALRGAGDVGRRAGRARGEGDGAVGSRLGGGRGGQAARLQPHHRRRGSRPRSHGARRRQVAGAPPGAALHAHRARRCAERRRRGAAAARDGLRDRERAPGNARRAANHRQGAARVRLALARRRRRA